MNKNQLKYNIFNLLKAASFEVEMPTKKYKNANCEDFKF